MKEALNNFWYNLLERLSSKINQWLNKDDEAGGEVNAADKTVINFFLMVLKAVLNRTLLDCTFNVISDSALAAPLKKAVKDLEKNAYKIGGYMLGGSKTPDNRSECWAILVDKRCGIHHFLSGSEVVITAKTGEHITDCFMIWNVVKRKNKTFFLCRRHTLSGDGTLTIRFFIADEAANEINADIPEWDNFIYAFDDGGLKRKKQIVIKNANHIGFGRYKSPVFCMGNDTYGKPLNFGCGRIEKEIQNTLDMIRLEFKATKTKLFPDWSIVKRDDSKKAYVIDEYIYPTKQLSGVNDRRSNMVEYFSPEIRQSAYFALLQSQLEQYQALMGVSELITHSQSSNKATATEIKALNINNVSLENSIRKAFSYGNEDTLKADSLYYGIREDLWTYDEAWKDIYEDEQQTLQNNIAMTESGGQSRRDLIKYWFPTFNDDETDKKLAEINEEKSAGISRSLEDMLMR